MGATYVRGCQGHHFHEVVSYSYSEWGGQAPFDHFAVTG